MRGQGHSWRDSGLLPAHTQMARTLQLAAGSCSFVYHRRCDLTEISKPWKETQKPTASPDLNGGGPLWLRGQ